MKPVATVNLKTSYFNNGYHTGYSGYSTLDNAGHPTFWGLIFIYLNCLAHSRTTSYLPTFRIINRSEMRWRDWIWRWRGYNSVRCSTYLEFIFFRILRRFNVHFVLVILLKVAFFLISSRENQPLMSGSWYMCSKSFRSLGWLVFRLDSLQKKRRDQK